MTETYTYRGQLWHQPNRVPHLDLLERLQEKNRLVVLRHGSPPYQVVLGAPHHVPSGVWRICEERLDENGQINDRCGDDNVASFALVAFSHLRELDIPCKLVIMAHASTQDPNKVLDSPYCQEIFRDKCNLLFECHASAGRRRLELELSAGSNPITPTVRFGQTLVKATDYYFTIGVQTIAGQRQALIFQPGGQMTTGELQLPATKTTSLIEAGHRGIAALHLEAKPHFRIVRGVPDTVSRTGQILGWAIAETIAQI